MAPLRVLITGAGVGGSALAFWLARLNHNVTIVERHSCLRVNGLQLDLRGFGIEVMKRMGLEQKIRAKLAPEEGVAMVDSTGRHRAYFPANKSGKGAQSMTSEFEIMRRDLCQILHDEAVNEGAQYIFGTYVDSFTEHDGIVTVKLADGRTNEYDLVVGADGLGSRLRRMMAAESTGDSKDSLVELRERMAYFTIPKPMGKNDKYIGEGYLLPGRKMVFTRRHNPHEIQVYLSIDVEASPTENVKAMRKGDVQSEKKAFAELFRNGGWRTDEFVKALEEGAEDWYCQYMGYVKPQQWSKGHVTLVGDAAHGAPADGMGTSAALIGAYILAGELHNHCGTGEPAARISEKSENKDKDPVTAALEAYEQQYQPYIAQIHKGLSPEPSAFEKYFPWNAFTLNMILYIAWFVAFVRLDLWLARLMPIEGVKGWTLPEYDMIKS